MICLPCCRSSVEGRRICKHFLKSARERKPKHQTLTAGFNLHRQSLCKLQHIVCRLLNVAFRQRLRC
ncbi:hypothetical protein SNE40_011888 [Patella caerulea]|uniref:Uncharacterized protein n=1 Tax=Patella caerulea TaxID=87958 RepID=A0AAN8JP91_PATCE